jgi:uncharacterized protein YwgA
MTRLSSIVADVVKAGDGKIVGKVRFQKILYLLEQLGMGGRIPFSYHHYGPYAESVSSAIDYAELVDRTLIEEPGTTGNGYSFVSYKLNNPDTEPPESVGDIPFDAARDAVRKMQAETSVNIELAATIHWLQEKERVPDWRGELVRRKTTKATPENIDRALVLLKNIGLQ